MSKKSDAESKARLAYNRWFKENDHEWQFLHESNRIEGIQQGPTDQEFKAFDAFMELVTVTVADLQVLISVFQPDARLRDKVGLDVRVGNHYPPRGGPSIPVELTKILLHANSPDAYNTTAYAVHQQYEHLHPFTDGNGRSGRMLWWKMMGGSNIGFLHRWYYQSLENHRA